MNKILILKLIPFILETIFRLILLILTLYFLNGFASNVLSYTPSCKENFNNKSDTLCFLPMSEDEEYFSPCAVFNFEDWKNEQVDDRRIRFPTISFNRFMIGTGIFFQLLTFIVRLIFDIMWGYKEIKGVYNSLGEFRFWTIYTAVTLDSISIMLMYPLFMFVFTGDCVESMQEYDSMDEYDENPMIYTIALFVCALVLTFVTIIIFSQMKYAKKSCVVISVLIILILNFIFTVTATNKSWFSRLVIYKLYVAFLALLWVTYWILTILVFKNIIELPINAQHEKGKEDMLKEEEKPQETEKIEDDVEPHSDHEYGQDREMDS